MPKNKMTIREWEQAWDERFPDDDFHDLADLSDFGLKNPEPEVVRFVPGRHARYEVLNEDADDWYEIAANRCDTAEKLVEWIGHLAEKLWVTKHHLTQLISAVNANHPKIRDRDC